MRKPIIIHNKKYMTNKYGIFDNIPTIVDLSSSQRTELPGKTYDSSSGISIWRKQCHCKGQTKKNFDINEFIICC